MQSVGISQRNTRKLQALLARAVNRDRVARIGVAHDARGRIVPEYAFQPARGIICAVCHDHHAGMLGIADANASAMMN